MTAKPAPSDSSRKRKGWEPATFVRQVRKDEEGGDQRALFLTHFLNPRRTGRFGVLDEVFGLATCVDCPPGTFSSSPMATKCVRCEAGKHAAVKNREGEIERATCATCPDGSYSKEGWDVCETCQNGKSASVFKVGATTLEELECIDCLW